MIGHLSGFEIDAWELGALSEEACQRVDAHRAACAHCQKIIDEAAALKDRFAREVFPRTLAAVVARRARSFGGRRLGWRWPVGAAALAGLALVVVVPRLHQPAPGAAVDDGPSISLKGGPGLRVFARRGGQVFAVRDGAHLRDGDEVRFVAQSAGFPYLLIASVDGAAKVSVYYPYDGDRSGQLIPDVANELPDSIRLDATPGPERLFALFSRTPISAADVRASLAAVATRGHTGIRTDVTAPVHADAALTLLFEKDPP